ncbi:hypothetical protein RKD29_006514 [Streptomyces tendae]|uniref:hypothetical protein n=1 Tax=Streptomyces tendae TaxID=1932 RepID=UPI0038365E7E
MSDPGGPIRSGRSGGGSGAGDAEQVLRVAKDLAVGRVPDTATAGRTAHSTSKLAAIHLVHR